ncbi:hypothetical protein L207DRAFT_620386 [Hyaloscypha variabilis F]|uniref:Uncharacterized protein n=1 Tax=Hyaloscypha variabilis (strain UAMH 11265 / GT02V1 / F) TaxID=1149755 RepID=A0A2J6RWT8_HYAVF|nr:hypothetical protein L207DRAFT_620386 [Hyaloscypha variabilis F]
MAVQLPRLWDAYHVLDIMTRGSRRMKCVATCHVGPPRRCRWDNVADSGLDIAKVENLLQDMETRPPREALPLLAELAHHSLCQGFHKRFQEQADRIIKEWTRAIHEASKQYNGSLRPEFRLQDPYRGGIENPHAEVEYSQDVSATEWATSNLGVDKQTVVQRSYQQMAAERDTLNRQATDLESQLREAEKRLTCLSQEFDQAKREHTTLTKKIESLTTKLDSEARSFDTYQAETQTQHKRLSNTVKDLQSQLIHAQQATKSLAADHKQAIDSQATLSAEKTALHSLWETEHEKCAKLSDDLEKLRLRHAETERLRTELARQQSQATAQWRQAQSDLKISAEAHDALKTSSALTKKNLSFSVAKLTGQLNAERRAYDGLRKELNNAKSSLLETQVELGILQGDIEAQEMTAAQNATVASAVSNQKWHLTKNLSVGFKGALKRQWKRFGDLIKSVKVRNRGACSGDSVEMV